MGRRYLEDVLETMGRYVDILKFSGGSFSLIPRPVLADLIEVAHGRDVVVSTGGFSERVVAQGADAVTAISMSAKHWASTSWRSPRASSRLPRRRPRAPHRVGPASRPESQAGSGHPVRLGGATAAAELEAEGTRDAGGGLSGSRGGTLTPVVDHDRVRGITENVHQWRTDAMAEIVSQLGLERVIFEAADPAVFEWYVKN